MRKKDLDVRLARYALMAGAAVAAAKPANATVVFTVELGPIDFSTGDHSLDLNGDFINDFFFSGGPLSVMGNSISYPFTFTIPGTQSATASSVITFSFGGGSIPSGTGSTFDTFTIAVTGGSPVSESAFGFSVDQIAGGSEAIAFGTGQLIGTEVTSWMSEAAMDEFTATGLAFLGLDFFDSNGNQYFGFAEFDPQNLIGFAFENNPDTSITTFDLGQGQVPEPGTAAMLALGAVSMEVLRRRRKHRL